MSVKQNMLIHGRLREWATALLEKCNEEPTKDKVAEGMESLKNWLKSLVDAENMVMGVSKRGLHDLSGKELDDFWNFMEQRLNERFPDLIPPPRLDSKPIE